MHKFFAALTEHLDLRRFEPRVVLESGDPVLAMFDIEAIVRRTGKRLDEGQAAHIWHFDRAGRISSYKNAVDSFGASKALRAD